MRLRSQFMWLNGGLVLLVVLIVSAAIFFAQKRTLLRTLEEDQSRRAQAFAEVCRQSYLLKNELLLAGYMKTLTQHETLAYAYFVDDQDRIRVHSDVKYLYKPLAEWRASGLPAAVERAHPVALSPGTVGTAVLGFGRAQQDDFVRRSLARTASWLAGASVVAAAAGLLLAAGFASVMARPIHILSRAAHKVGEGDFTAQVAVRASREVEDLAGTFNRMAAQLAHLEELKEEFIAILSHDLRAPLGAISTFADALKAGTMGPLTDQQKDYVQVIRDKARHLIGFADDILDLAKMKAGKMEYAMKDLDVGDLSRRVAELFSLTARRGGTVLRSSVPAGLTAWGDAAKLERVLTNLISNALKFVPRENGLVEILADKADGRVRLCVSDNGSGISEKDQAMLFQKFSRVDAEGQRRRNISGTGIGLTIVKSIVEAHGGRVWVESSPGAGSRFLFTVAAAEPRP